MVEHRAIKIKDLARELGVTSRALIDRCRAEGLRVQNSITKITPSQAEMVRAWFPPDSRANDSASGPGTRSC